MKLVLEKLSRYWQLRFMAVGAGILLIVYAILLPDPGNKSRDASIVSVAAAPLTTTSSANSSPLPVQGGLGGVLTDTAAGSARAVSPWLGANNPLADQLSLAVAGSRNAGLPRDFSESIRALRKGAEEGNAVAQFLLGHAYETGVGVPKDMTETARWYGRAVKPRSAEAANGASGVAPKDFAQAFEMYRNTAEQGDASAELYVGLAYDLGQDLPRSSIEAARWYRKAAAQGSYSAANNLGVLYHGGDGLPKDSVEAAVWLRSAAQRGSASAQYGLGRLYYDGDGVAQSYTEAAGWLEKAARQGSAQAQVLLSYMSATGNGVAGSVPMAYMWINLASASEGQARDSRDRIEKVIPADEIAEGQKLTHDWLTQHERSNR
jgi:TPR repeat protein